MFIVPFDQNGEIDYQNWKFINGTMEECTEKDFAGMHDDHSKYLCPDKDAKKNIILSNGENDRNAFIFSVHRCDTS